MKYLLDTNAWIHYLNQSTSSIRAKLTLLSPADVYLCSVVLGELFYGAYRSTKQAANLAVIGVLAQQFVSLPLDDAAAAIAGRLRADLAAAGTPIAPYDVQIAAIALASGLTVVTHNTKEFGRVPGLAAQDWQIP